jgi:hypothetical protein
MRVRKNIRRAAGTVALALAAAAAFGPAAFADSTNDEYIYTPNWEWDSVTNNGVEIVDAYALYSDFDGSGVTAYGFASDAFDSFFNEDEGGFEFLGPIIPLDIDPVSENYVDGGLSTLVGLQQLDFGNGNTFDVNVTLEIQGSFARWTVDIVATGAGSVSDLTYAFEGNLGSDDGSVYVPLSAGQMVSYQSADVQYGIDPIIGWHLVAEESAVIDAVNDDDDVFIFGSGDFTLTVGLNDYDPCSFDAAYNAMVAAVPTFGSTFGNTLPSHYLVNCLEIPNPPAQAAGTPLDVMLPLTVPDEVTTWFSSSYDNAFETGVEAVFTSLPPGVTGSLEYVGVVPHIRLVGTMPAVTSTVSVLTTSDEYWDSQGWPFASTITLTAVLSDTGTTPETPWLAGVAGALAIVGAGLLAVRRFRH